MKELYKGPGGNSIFEFETSVGEKILLKPATEQPVAIFNVTGKPGQKDKQLTMIFFPKQVMEQPICVVGDYVEISKLFWG